MIYYILGYALVALLTIGFLDWCRTLPDSPKVSAAEIIWVGIIWPIFWIALILHGILALFAKKES